VLIHAERGKQALASPPPEAQAEDRRKSDEAGLREAFRRGAAFMYLESGNSGFWPDVEVEALKRYPAAQGEKKV
jgi:hypothetical protein